MKISSEMNDPTTGIRVAKVVQVLGHWSMADDDGQQRDCVRFFNVFIRPYMDRDPFVCIYPLFRTNKKLVIQYVSTIYDIYA